MDGPEESKNILDFGTEEGRKPRDRWSALKVLVSYLGDSPRLVINLKEMIAANREDHGWATCMYSRECLDT